MNTIEKVVGAVGAGVAGTVFGFCAEPIFKLSKEPVEGFPIWQYHTSLVFQVTS